ncbi:MAG: response regulator transcription factor [Bdellovibrionales bacterium]|nr:response regulator transcription factor [Bdellovibrionales bacterium]
MNNKVILVEDEQDIADVISIALKQLNIETIIFSDGKKAIDYIQDNNEKIDLYILDRMLPGRNGIEICHFLRMYKTTQSVPILMLTAMTKPEDIIEGLDAGADDYVSKPFDINILLARVKALIRRGSAFENNNEIKEEVTVFTIQGIKIDTDQFKAWCDGEIIELTVSEFKLLMAFLKNPGKVYTRNQLVEYIQDGPIAVTDRTIDTHVFGLRKKLGLYSSLIETVRGIGYRVRAEKD